MHLRTTLLLATLVTSSFALAAEDAPRENPQAKSKSSSSTTARKPSAPATTEKIVFTNEDLERRFGPPSPLPAEPEAPAETAAAETAGQAETAPPTAEANPEGVREEQPKVAEDATAELDPLEQLAARQQREAERLTEIATAEGKVDQARRRISDLEKRIHALRNPLLARPAPPEEGREEWESANTGQRVDRSMSELDKARAELAEAEQELARLRNAP